MNNGEVFRAAFAKIRQPENWCREEMARDASGRRVYTRDPSAQQWCSMGALEAIAPVDEIGEENEVYWALRSATGIGSLSDFNDKHTHAEVVALWEKVGRENGWLE